MAHILLLLQPQCLNPSFSGSYSLIGHDWYYDYADDAVLILLFLEVTL